MVKSRPFERGEIAELDPQAEVLLETVGARGLPPTYGLSVDSARYRLEELFGGGGSEDVDRVEEFAIGGPAEPIPVRLYGPAGDGHPLVVFLHGVHESEAPVGQPKVRAFGNGGWALSNAAACAVLSVDIASCPNTRSRRPSRTPTPPRSGPPNTRIGSTAIPIGSRSRSSSIERRVVPDSTAVAT